MNLDETPEPVGLSPTAAAEPDLSEFEQFWKDNYKKLLVIAMVNGAALHEAHDVADAAMEEVLRRWYYIEYPAAYAKRAVVSNLIKLRTRPRNLVSRLVVCGEVADDYDDADLTIWEDREWVDQLLSRLPPAQREVMDLTIKEFDPAEIAKLLGKNPAAVRQNLCAARQRLKRMLRDDPVYGSSLALPPPQGRRPDEHQ